MKKWHGHGKPPACVLHDKPHGQRSDSSRSCGGLCSQTTSASEGWESNYWSYSIIASQQNYASVGRATVALAEGVRVGGGLNPVAWQVVDQKHGVYTALHPGLAVL